MTVRFGEVKITMNEKNVFFRRLRYVIPTLIILLWLAFGAIGGPYFGKISEVSSNDQTAYLPSSSDATFVQSRLSDFRDSDSLPALVIIKNDSAFTEEELSKLGEKVATLPDLIPGIAEGSPLIPSSDGMAAQLFVPLEDKDNIREIISSLEEAVQSFIPENSVAYVTGPAGFTADLLKAFSGIDGLLLGVALVAVFIILIIVYRSLLLPIAVLTTSLMALTVALLTNWWLAKWGLFMLSGQTQGILFILVIGAATDYSLLYVSRFREELRKTKDLQRATTNSLRGAFEPILASGGTVIAGLLCLLLSDLKSNSSLGPVATIGIIFAMISALTLLPAILFLFGRVAFWPKIPHFEPDVVKAEHGMPNNIWSRLAKKIRRHPRPIWVATTLILLLGVFGAGQLNASGVAQSDLILGSSSARDGQEVLGNHFAGGSGTPVYILASETDFLEVTKIISEIEGVDSVTITADSQIGSAPVTADGIQPIGPPGSPTPQPIVSEQQVMLQATLLDAADSEPAAETVRTIRNELSSTTALVGGVTATAIDTNDASISDRKLIIPVVLLVIFLILIMLLRSVIAPLILVATTVLSFGTALGVAALVFNHVFNFPGADPAVPLYGFVFLVALGIDYNIFLMTRVREESIKHGTREGISRGLALTGGVITSAGLVLAATFAALAVIPILFLAQIAFIVAFGVLLDTFIVRSLLVPAIATDIGRKIWWPTKLNADWSDKA